MGVKSPPRRYPPPLPPPHAVRNFARVRAFEAACPSCGRVAVAGTPKRNGYDPATGVWECLGCHRTWSVGILLWARPMGWRQARPNDQTPTLVEAIALRAALGQMTPEPLRGGRAARANRVCTCETGCPMHTLQEGPGPREAEEE